MSRSGRRLAIFTTFTILARSDRLYAAARSHRHHRQRRAVRLSLRRPDHPQCPLGLRGQRRRSRRRADHRLPARRRDARAQHRRHHLPVEPRRRRQPDLPDPARRRPDQLRLLRPLRDRPLPLHPARGRLVCAGLRASRPAADRHDRGDRRRRRAGLRVAAGGRALHPPAGDRRPVLLDRHRHRRHHLSAAVRRLAGFAVHRAIVADQPAHLRRLP